MSAERPAEDGKPPPFPSRYLPLEELGAGGMGVVWKAWDTQLKRTVALKLLKRYEVEDLQRFQREARLAAKLSHPHIAAIHDAGQENGEPYIDMQFVDGQTLDRFRCSDARILARLIRDAARALDYAHQRRIVHRDIKPTNLMVTSGGSTPEPHLYVMDFGIARAIGAGQSVTSSGKVVGSLGYMSPEQMRGEAVDARTDIYSLGATLHAALRGSPPGYGSTGAETGTPDVGRATARLDRDLRAIVECCLKADRNHRYRHASDLADDLDHYLAGKPVRPRRREVVYRIRKWVAGRKGAVALALGVIATLAGVALLPLGRSREHDRTAELGPQLDRLIQFLERVAAPGALTAGAAPPLEVEFDIVKEEVLGGRSIPVRVSDGDQLRDDGEVPKSGDNYKVLFGTNLPCHVYVAQADSGGKVTSLFPSGYSQRANPVLPGGRYEVPEGANWLHLDQRQGLEHVYLLASREPQPEIEKVLSQWAGQDAPGRPVARPAIVTRGVQGSRPGRPREVVVQGERSVFQPTQVEATKEGLIVLTRWFVHQKP